MVFSILLVYIQTLLARQLRLSQLVIKASKPPLINVNGLFVCSQLRTYKTRKVLYVAVMRDVILGQQQHITMFRSSHFSYSYWNHALIFIQSIYIYRDPGIFVLENHYMVDGSREDQTREIKIIF